MHPSCKPTSVRQNHKQTPSEMLYVNLHPINLSTVPIYELKNKYPKRVALAIKYLYILSPWLRDEACSAVGLKYLAAELHRLTGRYDNPTPEPVPSTSQGLRIGTLYQTREGWILLTVETEVNGDSKRTNERGPLLVGSLGLSCRYKRYLFCLGCSSWPNSK